MPIRPDKGLPEVGDLVEYSCHRGTVTLRIMWVEDPSPTAGYTNVWFEGCSSPTFNINWTTLNANTGTWRIVPETKQKPRKFCKPTQPKNLKRVQATDGSDSVYSWDGNVWRDSDNYRYTWSDLFEDHDEMIEVLETPYERAIEFFKSGTPIDETAALDAFHHARVIIEKAIESDGG